MLTAAVQRAAAGVVLLVTSLWIPIAAYGADDPPVTCPLPDTCVVDVEKPGDPPKPPAPDPAPSTVPAPRECNIEPLCGDDPATAEEVAERAVALLPLSGPEIGIAPAPGGSGLVGLPVWLWTAQTPEAWGPITRTATVTGLAVTATANAVSVSWEMGDGGVVECDGPGTPYTPDAGLKASPDCGYVYARSSRSQPGGVWTVLGTTTWEVAWQTVGGGPSGVVETTASTETTVRIDELQVVTQ